MSTNAALAIAAMLFHAASASASLPPGAIAAPLTRSDNLLHYLVEARVGTPPQTQYLVVDTGSPTVSVQWFNNTICNATPDPCIYGTYDNYTSSTAIYTGGEFTDALIDHGAGSLINDTVALGSTDVGRLLFGQVEQYYGSIDEVEMPIERIMGLALSCGYGSNPTCNQAGPYVLSQLYNASIITRRAVSFYLGPDAADTNNSQIIFGAAYDRAKQAGQPFTVPMVDPHNAQLSNTQTNSANITAFSVQFANGSSDTYLPAAKEGAAALIDTGNPYLALPTPLFYAVADVFGVPSPDPYDGLSPVDCKFLQPNPNNFTVHFATGDIVVPFDRLVTDYGNGTCASFVTDGGNFSANPTTSLGDPFLRSTYITFDSDALQITLSQVKYTSDEEIVALS